MKTTNYKPKTFELSIKFNGPFTKKQLKYFELMVKEEKRQKEEMIKAANKNIFEDSFVDLQEEK